MRVHTDGTANKAAEALGLGAEVFTMGTNIFFRQGAYNLGSWSGRELLAHELIHVVQSKRGSGFNI
ncbi:MAG: DUF4157 domain-containing protein [Deltaproteobacteria bacterium]|nr:DUF4157 domain-containing protein [Deltaproteobacteria bacterium]